MKAGLAMYIANFVLGFSIGLFYYGLYGPPEISEENAAGLSGIACLLLILEPADIVGFIMACLGRAWGAILMTCTTAVGGILGLAAVNMMGIGWSPIRVLGSIFGVASLVCFLVPSAWAYYRQSDAYRKSN
jgi:hypothetical protein